MSQGIFITGTDTDVGKTIVTAALGLAFQKRGVDVRPLKPVQCAGHDAAFLKDIFKVKEPLDQLNPFFAPDPLSPHVAFAREGKQIDQQVVIQICRDRISANSFTLVEGAGGVMVPINHSYLMRDLIKDLNLPVIVVARSGLGTINHTLLTLDQLRSQGVNVLGVILNDPVPVDHGEAERTNPAAIEHYGRSRILGRLRHLGGLNEETFLEAAEALKVDDILEAVGQAASSNQKMLKEWDKQYVWHPFTQMKDWMADDEDPLVIVRGEGNDLIDSEGNRYLDGVSSLWVNVHGHNHPVINQKIMEQVNRLSHSTLLGLANEPSIELAKRLVEITPEGLEKVFYSDSGSTAVEIGVKMAYQYWKNLGNERKNLIAHLANSYHGDTLGSVSVGGIDLFHKVYRNLRFETLQVDFPDCYRSPQGESYPKYAFDHIDRFEATLKERHQDIAALVLEPLVQGAAGMIVWPKGVLKRFRELCDQYDVLLIADEVATGFGRTGRMFACEHEAVVPDILCLAKGITGGYLPLAATMTTHRVFEGFLHNYEDQKTFFHGHTYTGNPLGCAAALANLEVFDQEQTLKLLPRKIKRLSEGLRMFYNLDHVGDVRQRGMMIGIELVQDRETKTPFAWQEQMGVKVCKQLRGRGVLLRPLGPVVVLMPPLSITDEEIDRLLAETYAAIAMVTQKEKGALL